MAWLFGKSKSSIPAPTALQTQRARQIETLKSFNQNVSEIRRDEEYRVNLNIGTTNLSLYITLSPRFPQERPVVKLVPPVRHPWVNEQMLITGCPGINNFVVHSDLGRVIREVVDEFQRNPPTLTFGSSVPGSGGNLSYPLTSPQLPGYRPYDPRNVSVSNYAASVPMPTLPDSYTFAGSDTTVTTSAAPYSRVPPLPSAGLYQMPELPNTFPQLSDYSLSDLRELTENEGKLFEIIQSLPQLEVISKERDNISRKNEEQAEENLTKKPLIETQKEILLEKFEILNDLRRRFDESSRKQEEFREYFSMSSIQNNLKVAAMQADEESELIAERFLEGGLSLEEFLQKFMEKRKLCHLRKVKEEKLSQGLVRTVLPS